MHEECPFCGKDLEITLRDTETEYTCEYCDYT
jgi:DNA-directed RNA polymerase subunit RPC12/RpoP